MAKKRSDPQISGLAGEFFVAAELLKRGYQTSVTFGNAKAIDLLTVHPVSGRTLKVQVKTLRSRNFFPIKPNAIKRDQVYVFVLLNKPGQSVEFYVVPGAILAKSPGKFGKGFQHRTFPGIHPRDLQDFKGDWSMFEEKN